MKFYIITKGSYSEYHIIAVTSDKKKAEVLKKIYSTEFEEARIEVYEEGSVEDYRPIYFVGERNDGTLYIQLEEYHTNEYELNKIIKCRNGTYNAYIRALNKDQAEKIFYDLKAEYLARKNGVD